MNQAPTHADPAQSPSDSEPASARRFFAVTAAALDTIVLIGGGVGAASLVLLPPVFHTARGFELLVIVMLVVALGGWAVAGIGRGILGAAYGLIAGFWLLMVFTLQTPMLIGFSLVAALLIARAAVRLVLWVQERRHRDDDRAAGLGRRSHRASSIGGAPEPVGKAIYSSMSKHE